MNNFGENDVGKEPPIAEQIGCQVIEALVLLMQRPIINGERMTRFALPLDLQSMEGSQAAYVVVTVEESDVSQLLAMSQAVMHKMQGGAPTQEPGGPAGA